MDCFTAIVAAEDVRKGKPDPEPFRLAFERLRERHGPLEPGDCAAVEDSLGGILSAQSAGMPCLGIAHSYPRQKLETAKPQWVIDSISEFADWLTRV
jgi:beta-phosphoglucomutase-like phosphatase (HAD superfamily)